jgi:hypothetical protein
LSTPRWAAGEALVSPGWYAPKDTEPFPLFDATLFSSRAASPYVIGSDDDEEQVAMITAGVMMTRY